MLAEIERRGLEPYRTRNGTKMVSNQHRTPGYTRARTDPRILAWPWPANLVQVTQHCERLKYLDYHLLGFFF